MSILKVSPTQSHTITVASAETVEGQFGPQVKFTTDTGDLLFVSQASADRQLQRLGVDLETVRGETLTISQVKKDSKTFTNIDRASGKAPAHNYATSPNAPAGFLADQDDAEAQFLASVREDVPVGNQKPADAAWASLFAHYDRCMEFVLNVEAPKLRKAGVEVTHEGLSAQTATLLIAAKDRRIAA